MRKVRCASLALILCCVAEVFPARAQSGNEWYTYRYNYARTGAQPFASSLSDPDKVKTLAIGWAFPATAVGIGPFRASPIVVNDTVFIGNENGYFYALDAANGQLKWQYPKQSNPPLLGTVPLWAYGIRSSASFWADRDAVIFGAQDPSLGPSGTSGPFGSARLFALDAKTGAEIWKSDPVATINGTTLAGQGPEPPPPASLVELHQRITFSAPLIFNNRAYVGIHDTGDSPIQRGQVIAVDLDTGHVDLSFHFQSVGVPDSPPEVRGGGVWNAVATDGSGVYFTTGNTRIPWCSELHAGCACPPNCPFKPEPVNNLGLSMIRINKDTGKVVWFFQPVDFAHDVDPDWAAGATVMSTSCGELIASVQKDGWSYAVDPNTGKARWQFPPTGGYEAGSPDREKFLKLAHGNDDYRRPGAAWNDVFIVRTGGEALDTDPLHDNVGKGYGKLHALNACTMNDADRVRWIADIPNISCGGCLGQVHVSYSTPTVTGGIVFIGTNQDPNDRKGHLVVLGDPSVAPPAGKRCSNVDYSPENCPSPYVLVPIPTRLASVPMPDGGSLAGMRNEPVLAKGRVFVATSEGHVYMLEPGATPPPVVAGPVPITATTADTGMLEHGAPPDLVFEAMQAPSH
jgi:outer membrane protein assembly factor BamB